MREHKRSSHVDARYRKNQLDWSPAVNIKQSVVEMRGIYSNMSEQEFAKWYSKRYRLPEATVIKILNGQLLGAVK